MPKHSLDIVVPVYNEETVLGKNINHLLKYCQKELKDYDLQIIIADNASTDKTPQIAKNLAKNQKIKYLRIEKKGRGIALNNAWQNSHSSILTYMDVDLSSNLAYFKKLLDAVSKSADIAIGSRLLDQSSVEGRTILRETMSRSYNFILRNIFNVTFHDAQCGFKAIKKTSFDLLSPLIKNKNWFFDSELLITAQKANFKIAEIPITWHDDPRSTVRIATTVFEDLLGLTRLYITKPWLKVKRHRKDF